MIGNSKTILGKFETFREKHTGNSRKIDETRGQFKTSQETHGKLKKILGRRIYCYSSCERFGRRMRPACRSTGVPWLLWSWPLRPLVSGCPVLMDRTDPRAWIDIARGAPSPGAPHVRKYAENRRFYIVGKMFRKL